MVHAARPAGAAPVHGLICLPWGTHRTEHCLPQVLSATAHGRVLLADAARAGKRVELDGLGHVQRVRLPGSSSEPAPGVAEDASRASEPGAEGELADAAAEAEIEKAVQSQSTNTGSPSSDCGGTTASGDADGASERHRDASSSPPDASPADAMTPSLDPSARTPCDPVAENALGAGLSPAVAAPSPLVDKRNNFVAIQARDSHHVSMPVTKGKSILRRP